MNRTGYEVLGYVVWRGAKWWAKRKVAAAARSRRTAAAGFVVATVAALVAIESNREGGTLSS